MIQVQACVKVADNTGAQKLICIRVLSRHRARLGSMIIAVVKESLPNISIRRCEIVRAVVIRRRKKAHRINGIFIRFDKNAVVIINKDRNPRRSRIFGPVARELRGNNFTKIISLAPEIT